MIKETVSKGLIWNPQKSLYSIYSNESYTAFHLQQLSWPLTLSSFIQSIMQRLFFVQLCPALSILLWGAQRVRHSHRGQHRNYQRTLFLISIKQAGFAHTKYKQCFLMDGTRNKLKNKVATAFWALNKFTICRRKQYSTGTALLTSGVHTRCNQIACSRLKVTPLTLQFLSKSHTRSEMFKLLFWLILFHFSLVS